MTSMSKVGQLKIELEVDVMECAKGWEATAPRLPIVAHGNTKEDASRRMVEAMDVWVNHKLRSLTLSGLGDYLGTRGISNKVTFEVKPVEQEDEPASFWSPQTRGFWDPQVRGMANYIEGIGVGSRKVEAVYDLPPMGR